MNKITLLVLSTVLFLGACTQSGLSIDTSKATELNTEIDSMSYLQGVNYAQYLQKNKIPAMDNKSFLTGMQRILEDKESEISDEDANKFMQAYFARLQEAQGAEAKIKNDSILSANQAMEGVKVTESGLQYKVIVEGDGPIPTSTDKVKVHYTGKFPDGKVFDSSVERGQPAEFGVTQVIKGWTEALTMMPQGSKWELVIPSELGYGSKDNGPIPANSILLFEVELLEIIKE